MRQPANVQRVMACRITTIQLVNASTAALFEGVNTWDDAPQGARAAMH